MAENKDATAVTREASMEQWQTGLNLLAKVKEVKLIMEDEFPKWIYTVRDLGNRVLFSVYNAVHDCCRCCCNCVYGPGSAPFTAYMKQSNNVDGVVLMSFERPLRLQSGLKGLFCGCLGQELKIEAPPGRRIASILEDYNTWGTSLTIYDAKGKPALKVIGPTLPPYFMCAERPTVFKVYTMTGTLVGQIIFEEQYGEIGSRLSVSFPANLDVLIKGSVIGCALLVLLYAFRNSFRNGRS
ncbi:phospholipid scramblase 1-like isoform X2 [Ornithodoros turicata]|uniref:phospholipid scramblase 1-like isoform X2 n=1 Tax=Ornithodoros turicata TaxID=34597 RepID=UPI00313899E4